MRGPGAAGSEPGGAGRWRVREKLVEQGASLGLRQGGGIAPGAEKERVKIPQTARRPARRSGRACGRRFRCSRRGRRRNGRRGRGRRLGSRRSEGRRKRDRRQDRRSDRRGWLRRRGYCRVIRLPDWRGRLPSDLFGGFPQADIVRGGQHGHRQPRNVPALGFGTSLNGLEQSRSRGWKGGWLDPHSGWSGGPARRASGRRERLSQRRQFLAPQQVAKAGAPNKHHAKRRLPFRREVGRHRQERAQRVRVDQLRLLDQQKHPHGGSLRLDDRRNEQTRVIDGGNDVSGRHGLAKNPPQREGSSELVGNPDHPRARMPHATQQRGCRALPLTIVLEQQGGEWATRSLRRRTVARFSGGIARMPRQDVRLWVVTVAPLLARDNPPAMLRPPQGKAGSRTKRGGAEAVADAARPALRPQASCWARSVPDRAAHPATPPP